MEIRLSRIIVLLLLAGLWMPAMAAVSVKLEGVKGELADNIEVYLQSLPELNEAPNSRVRDRISGEIAKAMQALGYFEPDIQLNWDDKAKRLTAQIDRGQPVTLKQVDIRIEGEGHDDPVLRAIIEQSNVRPGEMLHQGHYESLKSSLVSQALIRGYFDARLTAHEIRVSLADHSAAVQLVLDSGIRYHFGELSFEGDTDLLDQLEALRPFEVGDPFDNTKLGEFSQNLNDTGYFKSVVVGPQIDARKEAAIPVQVILQSRPANSVELGVGYSTDVGVRGKAAWTKPKINRHGHSFTSSLELSQPEQALTASYKIPKGHPLEDFYSIDLGIKRKDNRDTLSDIRSLGVKRQRQITRDWSGTLFTRIEQEDFIQGSDSQSQLLVIPGVSLLRNRNRGGLTPYWGDQQLVTLEVSDPFWGSDIRLAKLQLRSKWLRSIERRHKFIVRGDAGAIETEDFSKVPASMRFLTGGDQTIRGFAYESISPKDEQGALLGGRYLAVGSLEYSYPIFDKWALATFVDAGTSTNDFSEPLSVGTGVGFRWLTPVGPLKVDFAFAVSEPGNPFRLHITMGPEL